MKKEKKGQVSIEYLTIMGFVFLMIIPLIVIFMTQSNEMQDSITTNQAESVARKVSAAADSVYYLGYPSRTTLKVYMPKNVQYTRVENKEIVIGVQTSNGITEIVSESEANVTGSIQTFSGIQKIEIQAMEGYVNITSS